MLYPWNQITCDICCPALKSRHQILYVMVVDDLLFEGLSRPSLPNAQDSASLGFNITYKIHACQVTYVTEPHYTPQKRANRLNQASERLFCVD